MKVCSISQCKSVRAGVRKAVKQHKAERHARGFTSWGQFMAMSSASSDGHIPCARDLRRVALLQRAAEDVGVPVAPKRSTLAYADEHRPSELYQTVFEQLCRNARNWCAAKAGKNRSTS